MGKAEEIWDEILRDGAMAVRRFLCAATSEDQWIEFKRGVSPKDNLSKTASAFANTQGGVIIWGVAATSPRSDRTQAPTEARLEDVEAFRTELEHLTSAACEPPVQGIQHVPIRVGDGRDGFVATYVPASPSAPHRDNQQVYRMRLGSSSPPMPHALFAAYFGKHPVPSLSLIVAVTHFDKPDKDHARAHLEFLVRNNGDGPLADMYFSAVRVGGWQPGERPPEWEGGDAHPHSIYKRADESKRPFSFSIFTHPHYRVAPRGLAAIAMLTPYFHRSGGSWALEYEGVMGAVGATPVNWKLRLVPPPPALMSQKDIGGDDPSSRSTFCLLLTPDCLTGGEFMHHVNARLRADHGEKRGR